MSVSEQTMEVTDTDGYIMRTDIAYHDDQCRIAISPLDSYEQNRFYLLNISTQVRSARGQHLKSKIHILFKLYDNKVSEYKIMRKDAKLPKSKPRPTDYDARQAKRPPNKLDIELGTDTSSDRIAIINVQINLWVGIISVVLLLVGLIMRSLPMILVSAGFCACGAAHILIQIRDKITLSRILYNRGARRFNREQYQEAKMAFTKSVEANPNNEMAKYGLHKVEFFIK
jgi:hypothetical protein